MEYIIRKMKKQEYALLNDFLYEAIFIPEGTDAPSRDIINKPELQVYVSDFGSDKDDLCLAAETGGNIIGAVWVRNMKDYGNIGDGIPSFAISVLKQYRGNGIGTELMKRMLEELKRSGCKKASLSVQKNNYAAKMYQKLGFEIAEEKGEEYIMVYNFKANILLTGFCGTSAELIIKNLSNINMTVTDDTYGQNVVSSIENIDNIEKIDGIKGIGRIGRTEDIYSTGDIDRIKDICRAETMDSIQDICSTEDTGSTDSISSLNNANNNKKAAHINCKMLLVPNDKVKASKKLINVISHENIDYIISFGQRPNIKNKIHIETTAKDGQLKLDTDFDTVKLKELFEHNGITAKLSHNAGTSFCNRLYFDCLSYIFQNRINTKMVFIHIPFIKNISDFQNFTKKLFYVIDDIENNFFYGF